MRSEMSERLSTPDPNGRAAARETQTFTLTQAQRKARALLNSPAKHILLFGGSRSGKTFAVVRNIILRALKEPGSRHAVFRQTRQALKESIWLDTFPKVLRLCFAGVPVKKNETDLYAVFPNGSEIWFGFLDDNRNVDRVLGKEYNTIFFNECSEIPYAAVLNALTRLALKNGLVNKFYYDCNPPGRGHWSHALFIEKKDPRTGEPLVHPQRYEALLMNPADNLENLPPDYLDTLRDLPDDLKNRFLLGLWGAQVQGAVYGREIGLAEREGRIGRVLHDPDYPVYTAWDIGVGDETAVWFMQFIGERINFIDYYQNHFEGLPHYAQALKTKPYHYAVHFWPHDGVNRDWDTGRSRRETALKLLQGNVEILPRSAVEDGINGARILFPRCYFDQLRCADGLECVRNYRREWSNTLGKYKPEPVHDWASHGADALRYACMAYKNRLAQLPPKPKKRPDGLTFNDLLADIKKSKSKGW